MENNSSVLYKSSLLLSLVVIAISGIFTATNRGNATITVSGQATISAKPGEVSMVVTRATLGGSADEAVAGGEVAMGKIIEAAKKIAGNDVEIKKSFYQVTPQGDGKFLMANAISLKSTNVAAAGNLIKYLYANGATTVSNVVFSPKDDGVSEKQVRQDALADAKKKATEMATLVGKKVGRIVSIAEDTTSLSSSIGNGATTGSDIGTLSLDKRVSVAYEIQ